ncbi:protein NYNRIN [Trifolium repens]|nr:protein NYNRIN [Trifolium repens]
MDLLGPFPVAAGQNKFLIVGVDYFTKWIEAEPLAKITAFNILRFFKRNIPTVGATDLCKNQSRPTSVVRCSAPSYGGMRGGCVPVYTPTLKLVRVEYRFSEVRKST